MMQQSPSVPSSDTSTASSVLISATTLPHQSGATVRNSHHDTSGKLWMMN